jgi:hypothetical protein
MEAGFGPTFKCQSRTRRTILTGQKERWVGLKDDAGFGGYYVVSATALGGRHTPSTPPPILVATVAPRPYI